MGVNATLSVKNRVLSLIDSSVNTWVFPADRRNPNSRIVVNYGFEFATNGAKRRSGVASMGFPSSYTFTITLDLEEGRLIETIK